MAISFFFFKVFFLFEIVFDVTFFFIDEVSCLWEWIMEFLDVNVLLYCLNNYLIAINVTSHNV